MLKRTLLALCLCLPATAGMAETPRLPWQVRLAEMEAKLAEIDAGRHAEGLGLPFVEASRSNSEILVQAETKSWRRYVDGECRRRSMSYRGQSLADCRLELTEARIEKLQALAATPSENCFKDVSFIGLAWCLADRHKKVEARLVEARLKKAEAGLAEVEAARRKAAAEEDRWLRESDPQGYDIQERTAKASAKAWKAYVAAECAYRVAELTTGTLAGVEEVACPARLHEQRIRELGGE